MEPSDFGSSSEIDDRGPNARVAVLARDNDDFARSPECGEMAHRVNGTRRIVGFGRKAGQPADRIGADVLVRVGTRHVGENATGRRCD